MLRRTQKRARLKVANHWRCMSGTTAMMCGQQSCHPNEPSIKENGSTSRDEHAAEVPQQVQAPTGPAAAAVPKATGNVRRRLVLGEVVGAAVAAIEKRVEECAKTAAVKESAGVKKGTAGAEKVGTPGAERKGRR